MPHYLGMKELVLSIILCFFVFNTQAQVEEDKNFISERFFKLVPEQDALKSMGEAYTRELKSESLKAIIWNIKKAEMLDWKADFLKFGQGRDLFLLQEAYERPVFKETLSSLTQFTWDMGISFLYRRYGDSATGTMVGSLAEPTMAFVRHSPDHEPLVDTPKSFTFARYLVEGKSQELLVISAHAINFETTGAFKRHIDRAIKEIKLHDGPILFAGDFNTWNASRTAYLYKVCEEQGLSAVIFKNGENRMKFGDHFLDHAFIRGLAVKNAEVISETNGSDHRPLLMEVDVL